VANQAMAVAATGWSIAIAGTAGAQHANFGAQERAGLGADVAMAHRMI